MAELLMRGIRKSFGAVEALADINIDVADGEFIVLVGPSGCGKSTLLRCIAGLEHITGGDIRIGGRSMRNVPTRDRNVAMVFQSYALFPHLTVADNIAFGMHIRRTDRNEVARKVTAAAEMLGLAHLTGRYPRELSGGQRQRVAMGRAIVRDPDVFLFDEPLSNLDAKLRVQMRTEIKALRQRLGITSIYVTHDQDEAMTLADRIVVMNFGRIEQVGTPLELYDNPANIFVAGFMGSPPMNFIAAELRPENGATVLVTTGGELTRGLPRAPSAPRSVMLGLRPEALRFSQDGPLAGTVEVVEPQGAHTRVLVRLANGESVYAGTGKGTRIAPGEAVRLDFDWSEAKLFEAEGGAALELDGLRGAAA